MANALIGSHPSHGFKVVEQLDSNKQLTRSDSGKLFMCDQQTSVVRVKLPKLSLEIAGWHAKFILRSGAGAEVFNIEAFGSWEDSGTTDDADTIQSLELGGTIAATSDNDHVEYGTNSATLGTTIEFYCDGTKWYALSLAKDGNDIEVGG